MNFIEFLSTHCLESSTLQNLRYGQWLMNELKDANPSLFTFLIGTEGDCFFLNEKIPKFWELAYENWDKFKL